MCAAIRSAVWSAICEQLVAQGAALLRPREMMSAGVRTPEQQARARREYLELLTRVELITGQLSGCAAADPLRAQSARFFQSPFFHRALLEEPAFAAPLPWLAEEYSRALLR